LYLNIHRCCITSNWVSTITYLIHERIRTFIPRIHKTWLVGTADDIVEGIAFYDDLLGGLENLVIFPDMPGDPYSRTAEQLTRFAQEVLPKLG
jgi:hypothetical protein